MIRSSFDCEAVRFLYWIHFENHWDKQKFTHLSGFTPLLKDQDISLFVDSVVKLYVSHNHVLLYLFPWKFVSNEKEFMSLIYHLVLIDVGKKNFGFPTSFPHSYNGQTKLVSRFSSVLSNPLFHHTTHSNTHIKVWLK